MNQKKKNILLISHELTYSGAPRSLLNLALLLKRQGNYVEVWSLQDGDFSKEFMQARIKLKVVKNICDKIYREIQKFDIAILNTFFAAHLVSYMQNYVRTILYIREAHNLPILARDCNLNENDIKVANEVICVSEYAESFIKERYNPSNITVVHNFVEDVYRGNLNVIKNHTINYLISGTYEYRKGFDIVIDAFNRMPTSLKEITKLHIVGRKPEWSKEFWKPLQEKYNSRIIDHGEIKNRKELMNLYKQMNVFIIASRDESCSLVALEGAMLGKALIMSENVGAKYLDLKNKGIYQTDNVAQLCRKMCELTSRRELIVRGIEMRRFYKKTSTEKVYMKNINNILL